MPDPRAVKLAQILVHYSTRVQEGDRVAVVSSPLGRPVALEVFRQVLRAGGHPHFLYDPMDTDHILLAEANEQQLAYISPLTDMMYSDFEVLIRVRAFENTRSLSGIDPAVQAKRKRYRLPIMEKYMARSASGDLRWCVTLMPTNQYAQEADMSLEDFEDFVYQATFADQDDPVACWEEISRKQQKLVDWLVGKQRVVAKGPNIDLSLSVADRIWINSDGTHNMPSGEIFTGPVEDSVNGWVRFSYPAIYEGRSVEGIELRFKDGKVVEASAEKNEKFLLEMLDLDEGSRYLGEWAIGTNKQIDRFIGNILYDEKIGGTIHMAIGAGYPETGSKNKSSIHWDMICDMRNGGQIFVDDELFYESGEFKAGSD